MGIDEIKDFQKYCLHWKKEREIVNKIRWFKDNGITFKTWKKQNLQELLDKCKKQEDNLNELKELLLVQNGFLFNGTDYRFLFLFEENIEYFIMKLKEFLENIAKNDEIFYVNWR